MNMGTSDPGKHSGTASPGEAERWFVLLLEADCSDEERAAFERWLGSHPSHRAEFRKLERAWGYSKAAVREPRWVQAANQALRAPQSRPWFQRGGLWAGAAACACAAVIALLLGPRVLTPAAESAGTRYATGAGQVRAVPLSDGSSLVLDTDSEVVVRYGKQERSVELLHGRAQFKVHGDHAWPFVVHALGGTVTAVGTWFQVRLDTQLTDVTLIEGKLAIATTAPGGESQQASLVGGQGLAFDRMGHISAIHPADVEAAQAWPEGRLLVHDCRLADLVAQLNRYNTTKLEIGDPSLQDLRVSGSFRASDVDTVLLLLQRGWPIQAKYASEGRIVLVRTR